MRILGHVAGTSFRPVPCRDAFRRAPDPSPVTLEAEPNNKFDEHAIKVILDGHHVGYIGSPSTSKLGTTPNTKFHAHKALWDSAILTRNDIGEYRVVIGRDD